MKKFLLTLSVVVAGLVYTNDTYAQINLNVNIGSQPVWGPTGYDHVDYYYLPDLDVYYNVPEHQWVYNQRGRWTMANSLPSSYKNVDLYRAYKVVINDSRPYLRNDVYKKQYASYRNRRNQPVIRDSRDSKYFVINEHPEHSKWVNKNQGRDSRQANRGNKPNERTQPQNDRERNRRF